VIYTTAGLAFGSNYNTTFNPARDVGLRFVSWAATYGRVSASKGWNWGWIPLVGPCIGALAGVLTYMFSIEYFWPRTDNLSLPLTEYDMTHQIIGMENNDPSSYNFMASFKDVLIDA
jgi:Major intrinsic protein